MANLSLVLDHLKRLIHREAPSTDQELLHRFVSSRDEAAFSTLMERHGPLVIGTARRVLRNDHEAEDVFQATFVLLVQKAGSIHGCLPAWLHKVAFHLALFTRKRSTMRAEREMATARPLGTPAEAWHEAQTLVDAELERLPARYREPLTLCYLMGKTTDEAAQDLGCTSDAVRGRLARGREMLRGRLARQGVATTAALLTAFLAENAGLASVPAACARSTLDAALTALGKQSLPGNIVPLLQEGARQMFMAKVKTIAVVTVAMLVLALGAGLVGQQVLAGKGKEAASKSSSDAKAPAEDKGKTEPSGVPLELKLVAKQETYTLDLRGLTEKQFRDKVNAQAAKRVGGMPPQKVSLQLELRNTGRQEVKVILPKHQNHFAFVLEGPGVITGEFAGSIAAGQETITLAAGKSHIIPISYLETVHGLKLQQPYWTKLGEYTLKATDRLQVALPAKGDKFEEGAAPAFKGVPFTSNPVKLQVVEAKKEAGKTEPAGVPLELKLINNNKDYYPLASKAIDMQIEVRNTGSKPLRVWLSGDPVEFILDLQGPGAVNRDRGLPFTTEFRGPGTIKIEAGKSHVIPLNSLYSGFRGQARESSWTQPGEHSLTVNLVTAVSPIPRGAKPSNIDKAFSKVVVTSNTVKFEVADKKPGAAAAKPKAAIVVLRATYGELQPKNDEPLLMIQADGSVAANDAFGSKGKATTRLENPEVQDLLRLVAQNKFFDMPAVLKGDRKVLDAATFTIMIARGASLTASAASPVRFPQTTQS